MRKIEACLQALQAGVHNEEIVLETIRELQSCGPRELSEKRQLVASLFCRLLAYCQILYKGNVPSNMMDALMVTFEGLEHVCEEATDAEMEDSSMIMIWFLHNLKQNGAARMNDEVLQKSIGVLLEELDAIQFVFEIRENDQLVFPINSMIAKVVATPGFICAGMPLRSYHIRILQLAVKLFVNDENEQKILRDLLEKCNLRFIEYLNFPGCIIDTSDLLNHQKNGVMIFYNSQISKVLIRHEREDYFDSEPVWTPEDLEKGLELDTNSKPIGTFVEYTLDQNDLLVDYSEILKEPDGRERFLRLLFDMGTTNVLLEDTIIRRTDNTCLPINPFCAQDDFIVKGRKNDRDGKWYERKQLLDALREYRSAPLKISEKCIMNRISFGLGLLLLQEENTGVDALGLDSVTESEFYQDQVMRNWVYHCADSMEALKYLTEQWYRQNEYCGKIKSMRSRNREKNIQDQRIEALDIYPLRSDLHWIYQILAGEDWENCYILHGQLFEDEDGKNHFQVEGKSDVCTERWSENTGEDSLYIEVEENELFEWGDELEYYFLYDVRHHSVRMFDQVLLKMISGIENIQVHNHLDLQTLSRFSRFQYKSICSLMLLHKDALEQEGRRFFCDFDSQVYYRLLHNMLWSKVDEENIDSYLKIFLSHQKMSFHEIHRDDKFMRRDPQTLYVPKDGKSSDSTLSSVYEKYLHSKGSREENDLYDSLLELRENGYYHRGNRIDRIVFLCDNFECGSATVRMLRSYLDIGTEDIADPEKKSSEEFMIRKVKAREHKYYLKNTDESDSHLTQVFLKNVLEKNGCTVEVHGYYGTIQGKNTVDSFLQKHGIAHEPSGFYREIKFLSSLIKDEVNMFWPMGSIGDFFLVIREFNMTKMNVFPDEMLKDPKKAICMFVKKPERR